MTETGTPCRSSAPAWPADATVVGEAASGKEAVAIIEREQPDLRGIGTKANLVALDVGLVARNDEHPHLLVADLDPVVDPPEPVVLAAAVACIRG